MEFCPKCGYRLELKKWDPVAGEPLVLFCRNCRDIEREATKKVKKIHVKVVQHTPKEFIAVIGKEEQKLRTLPTIQVECPNAKNALFLSGRCRRDVLANLLLRSCGAQNATTHLESARRLCAFK